MSSSSRMRLPAVALAVTASIAAGAALAAAPTTSTTLAGPAVPTPAEATGPAPSTAMPMMAPAAQNSAAATQAPAAAAPMTPMAATTTGTGPAAAPSSQMKVATVAKPTSRHESAYDLYGDARSYGERALGAIDKASAAIDAKDATAARNELSIAINELGRAHGRAVYDTVATKKGAVEDWWIPGGAGSAASADAHLGMITTDQFKTGAKADSERRESYARYIAKDGAEVLLPLHDTIGNLESARAYVRKGDFAMAKNALTGLFDSTVMVSAEAPVRS